MKESLSVEPSHTETPQKTNDSQAFLGTAPIGKLLFTLAIPTVIAQLINMLYNVVDRIFIGHIAEVGNLALTGVGICLPIIMVVSAFAALVGAGGAPRASISLGRKDKDHAEEILGNCFSTQIILSIILTAILIICNKPFLMAFGASEATLPYASAYLSIYALGTLFVQITLGMNAFITAQGFAKISMYTVLIGAICNIILDPLFIFGLDLGVQGAAMATIISQALSSIWIMSFLRGKKTTLRIRAKYLRIKPSVILPCLALGASPFIMQASESVIGVCFNASLLQYGGDIAVGAMTILASVLQFAMMPLQGLAQGAQPITSYNYGARNAARVKKTFFVLLASCMVYSCALWLCVMIKPEFFARLFTPNADLIAFSSWALRIYCGALFIFGAQIACQMTFVSLGNAKSSIIVAIVRKFVLLLPLIYLVPLFTADPVFGVYLAEPIADIIAVIFTISIFAYQFRRALKEI